MVDDIAAKASEAFEAAKPAVEGAVAAVTAMAGDVADAAKPAVESAASVVKNKAEELFNRDLDGDGVIGEVSVADAEEVIEEEAAKPVTGWRSGTVGGKEASE